MSLDQCNEAAKTAIRIVRKFPQIDQDVLAPMLAREIGHAILDAISTLEAENARLRKALERNRQGLRNILEFRALANGRFGNLTREEIEQSIAEIDAARGGQG